MQKMKAGNLGGVYNHNYGIKIPPFLTTEELTFNHEIYNKINWV